MIKIENTPLRTFISALMKERPCIKSTIRTNYNVLECIFVDGLFYAPTFPGEIEIYTSDEVTRL